MASAGDLQTENARLKQLLADAELEKAYLREQIIALSGGSQTRSKKEPQNARRAGGSKGSPRGEAWRGPLTASPGSTSPPPLPDLGRRKQERLRHRIREVGLELFLQNGFEATTVDEIAAAADVSRRTFFRYFTSKEDILLVVMDEVQAEALNEVKAHYDGTHVSLLEALTVFSGNLDRRRSELMRCARLLGVPALYTERLRHSRGFEDALASVLAQYRGHIEATPEDRSVAAIAARTLSIAQRIWLEAEAREPFRDVFRAALGSLNTLGGETDVTLSLLDASPAKPCRSRKATSTRQG
jgi:AcrR family transcriptional regulator